MMSTPSSHASTPAVENSPPSAAVINNSLPALKTTPSPVDSASPYSINESAPASAMILPPFNIASALAIDRKSSASQGVVYVVARDDLSKIVGAAFAHTILKRFNPQHKGQFDKKLGGLYTPPLHKSKQYALRKLLDIIYPKESPKIARIWHSINFATNCVWIGVPFSTPPETEKQHKKSWLDVKKDEESTAAKRIAERFHRTAPQPAAAVSPQAVTINWNGFAADGFATHQKNLQARRAEIVDPEAREKREQELKKRLPDAVVPPAVFKQTVFGAPATVETPEAERKSVPPHVKHLQKSHEKNQKRALEQQAVGGSQA